MSIAIEVEATKIMEFQQGYLNIESHKKRYAQPWQTIPWKHYLHKTDIRKIGRAHV